MSEVALSGAGIIEEIIFRRRSPVSDCWKGIPVSAVLQPACVHTECENSALSRACVQYSWSGSDRSARLIANAQKHPLGKERTTRSASDAVKCGWNMCARKAASPARLGVSDGRELERCALISGTQPRPP